MKIHFIAIGGSAMHNLAIALKNKGYEITGSDDEIFEPSRSRLKSYALLPTKEGWQPEILDTSYDAVILGMHAKADNPELLRAKELKLKIYSYPEYLYEQSKNKTRIVISGSHGKTTITSMILHVLQKCGIDTDYMVGAKLKDFDVMVKLSDAPYIVLEGDEYLTSTVDKRPKFHLYHPDIAVVSGIAWDHINVFPSFENYIEQFRIFINMLPAGGKLIYPDNDVEVNKLADNCQKEIIKEKYSLPEYEIINDKTYIIYNDTKIELKIFGKHNLLNLNAARLVCKEIGVDDDTFYKHISTFSGASMRLEKIFDKNGMIIYRDFAHSPDKLKSTVEAVKEQYPNSKLVACIELHTFSSLNKDFLMQYEGSMQLADEAWVYYSPHALSLKNLPDIDPDLIYQCFKKEDLQIINSSEILIEKLKNIDSPATLLLMSSGNFDNIDFDTLGENILNNTSNC